MGEKKINREWVKTFAIIFLAVLLVLTFFSNTIMNMTLPEVSTEYIQYGSIKTQVRGSGTITASDNYSVTIPTTREILKVAVSKGTQVQKGDVLFYLAEGDSDELEAAKTNYDNLNYEYAKMLLDSANSDDFADKRLAIEQQQEDLNDAKAKLAGFAETQKLIEAAKLAVREAEKAVTLKQNEISELESEKTAIGYTPTEDEFLPAKTTAFLTTSTPTPPSSLTPLKKRSILPKPTSPSFRPSKTPQRILMTRSSANTTISTVRSKRRLLPLKRKSRPPTVTSNLSTTI